jgi:Heparinase II/III-like protein
MLRLFSTIILSFFWSFTIAQQRVSAKDALPNHPRLLFLNLEEKEILNRLKTDSSMASIQQVILKECDKILTLPNLERTLKGKRLLEVSREACRRVYYLSHAWRTTQNKKYFTRAEKELLAVCAFEDWNPSHFLDVAEMTAAVSIGYDWLYGTLSAASKDQIKKAIFTKGLKPSMDAKNNKWLTAKTNWNQVCNSGMTLGALAVFEDDPTFCSNIINRSISSVQLAMKEYDPDGNYPEGFGYWGYGTTYNVMMLSAIKKIFKSDFGLTANSGFSKTAQYMMHVVGPSGLGFNYSDNSAEENLNPAMFWFADNLHDPSILFWEVKYLRKNYKLYRVRELPFTLIWGAKLDLKKIAPPKQKIWVGRGINPVAMMRSSWQDKNSIFIGFKAGSPYINHGHMDVGEFVLDAMGQRWAMDFDPQSYTKIEEQGIDLWSKKQSSSRWQIYRLNNQSHSTLTINNQLQLVSGSATIISSSSKPEFLNAVSDITSLYKTEIKKATRGVTIVNSNYVLVQDEIEASNKPAQVVWKMLTSATIKISDKSSAKLTIDNKTITLQVLEPKNATLKTWTTKPKLDYEEQNEGTQLVGFEVTIPSGQKVSLVVGITTLANADFSKIKTRTISSWPKD